MQYDYAPQCGQTLTFEVIEQNPIDLTVHKLPYFITNDIANQRLIIDTDELSDFGTYYVLFKTSLIGNDAETRNSYYEMKVDV